jgi:cephalosporin-C deacetylase
LTNTRNPAAYGTTVVKPADFDEFWEEVLAQAVQIPLNATMTPVPLRSTAEVEVYEVHYDSLDGVRVAGWYCLPRQRSGPLPAQVFYPGYISEQIWLQPHLHVYTGISPACCSKSP